MDKSDKTDETDELPKINRLPRSKRRKRRKKAPMAGVQTRILAGAPEAVALRLPTIRKAARKAALRHHRLAQGQCPWEAP